MMKILNTPRFEKYALWFMTGKIALNPVRSRRLAHTLGKTKQRLSPQTRNWLSIFLAYLYENHRVTICYVTQDHVFTRGDSYDR